MTSLMTSQLIDSPYVHSLQVKLTHVPRPAKNRYAIGIGGGTMFIPHILHKLAESLSMETLLKRKILLLIAIENDSKLVF